MKKRKFILGCLTGLLFMAFVVMNITVSMSYQGDEMAAKLTLTELAAQAQNGEESGYDGNGHGTLVEGTSGKRYCCPGSNDCGAAKIPDDSWCP